MKLKSLLIIIFLAQLTTLLAQKSNAVLFSVENEPVRTDEFLRVFNKNRDIVSEENKKSIEEYLDLYINYKLKLKQAYDLKYDTVEAYQNELTKYKEQLIGPYLKDGKVTRALVKEVYDRTKTEVNASHILIMLDSKASPQDTLKAYNKIIDLRNKILRGANFEQVAREFSEDPSAKQNGGALGNFSAFDMVYEFENQAYNTKVNEISMPFKTQFGYHIVKVNAFEASKGEVEVAHIMIKEQPQDTLYAKTKINELYAKLGQNEPFEFLAKQHSDDRNSSINGGVLPKFNMNRMIPAFAKVAFSLEKENEISPPFKTQFGWHIVKLLKKHPIKSFNELKEELTEKIEKSDRSKMAGQSVVNRLIETYKITKDVPMINYFLKNDTIAINRNLSNMIFAINDKKVHLNDLVSYAAMRKNISANAVYKSFFDQKILEYYKDNLEATDQNFANTLQEYKDGLLLFDILQDKVWLRSENDTIALKAFFERNKEKYTWPKRGDVLIASTGSLEKAKMIQKALMDGSSADSIKKLINQGPIIHVIFTQGILEENHKKLPRNFEFTAPGVSTIFEGENKDFVIVKVNKIIESSPMQLNEARGRVINDFQKTLETEWINDLKRQYSVDINKKALKQLIKEHTN